MNLSLLFSLPYLLDKTPEGDFLFGFVLLAFFLLVSFIGSIMKAPSRKDKHLRKSLRKKLWFFPYLGAIGIILILSRFASLPVFSMRMILLITLILTVALLLFTFFRVQKEYTRRKKSAQREAKKRGKSI